MKRALLFVVLLSGCAPLPEFYRVPEQRNAKDGPEPEPMGAMLSFSNSRASEYILGGFLASAPDQLWRWASASPTVRVRVSDTAKLRMRLNFAFPDESHGPLLPITVRYFVNDKLLDTVVYKKAGVLEYKKAVPAEWLVTNADNVLRWEISPIYVAKADGVKLSMIVSEVGLEKDE